MFAQRPPFVMTPRRNTKPRTSKTAPSFPIVAIGASAGGLDPLKELIENLHADTGLGFVVIQHLSEKTKSFLPDILSRHTSMPVLEAADVQRVEPNHVYVMPGSADLEFSRGMLTLVTRSPNVLRHLPIDRFFGQLAADHKQQAIGVILSGAGSDGAEGLKAIRAGGGVTFAQDPATASQPDMPRHAHETGAVDFVLAPAAIARELVRIARHPYVAVAIEPEAPSVEKGEEQLFDQVFLLLRRVTGQDFSGYKRSTLKRRLSRRMLLLKLDRLDEYVSYASKEPGEVEALYQDLLIGVTEFFRDPETFEFLKLEVFPKLLARETEDRSLRIWVAGCANGKEAYSVAIALAETANGHFPARTQIFGTDINERDIQKARAGFYPAEVAAEVSPERLSRFFTQEGGGYRVSKELRDICTFARHDVAHDPPFSSLDFISCRNLMIYFDSPLQQRTVRIFHYALRSGGFLLLGRSETIPRQAGLFDLVDKNHHLYQKGAVQADLPVAFSEPGHMRAINLPKPAFGHAQEGPLDSFDPQREADRVMASAYASSSVLVNDRMEVVAFRGPTAPYLQHQSGKASFDLFLMTREGLAPGLRKAIEEANQTGRLVTRDSLPVKTDGGWVHVGLEVMPFKASDRHTYFIVAFREHGDRPKPETSVREEPGQGTQADPDEVKLLREELEAAREHVQSVIQEKDTGIEELKTAYEELQSSNEELQSTNEELETAKEELQSINEELTTVNDEFEQRNASLDTALDDINNLLATVNLPIIMLDEDLHIRRFTPGTEEVLSIIPSDVGRPITDISTKLPSFDLGEFTRESIASLSPAAREVQAADGRYYSVRVRPYKSAKSRVEGAVLTFVDADELKRGLDRVQEANRLNTALNEVNVAVGSTLDLTEIMHRVLLRATEALGADSGGILVPSDHDGWRLRFVHPALRAEELSFTEKQVPQIVAAHHSRLPVVIADAAGDDRMDAAFVERFRIGSELVVPLMARDEVIGALFLNREPGHAAFTEGELDFGSKLATTISRALENAHLYANEHEAARLSSALGDVMAHMAALSDVTEGFGEVLDNAASVLGAPWALLARLEKGEWSILQVHGLPSDVVGQSWGRIEAGAFPASDAPPEPLFIAGPLTDRRIDAAFVKEHPVPSLVLVPLVEHGTTNGLLVFGLSGKARDLGENERNFLRRLGAVLPLALSNARYHEAEHRLAESLRKRLSPEVPAIPGLEIEAAIRMAVEVEQVGGDFYDVFPTRDGRVAMLVGDVTGKGLPAASLTDAIRSSVRTLSAIDPSPVFAMNAINMALREERGDTRAATAVLVKLDVKTGAMEVVLAGHPPAIACADGCRLLEIDPAPPLGFNPGDYDAYTYTLGAGETLILYTDGLIEARRGDELLGEARLLRILEKVRSQSAKEIASHLLREAVAFAEGRPHDDIAIVVVRRTG